MTLRKLLELTETHNSLELRPIPGCESDLAECSDIVEALEHQLSNGWEVVRPEECGALTDGLIITRDCERNDHGELTRLGRVYWDCDYQVTNALERVIEKGLCRFAACE